MAAIALGRRIRALRVRRRLTLNDIADKAGIPRSALGQIERDRSNPTLSSLKAIASALDRAAAERGEVEVWECDEGQYYTGLQAAAQMLPFLPCRGGVGTRSPW